MFFPFNTASNFNDRQNICWTWHYYIHSYSIKLNEYQNPPWRSLFAFQHKSISISLSLTLGSASYHFAFRLFAKRDRILSDPMNKLNCNFIQHFLCAIFICIPAKLKSSQFLYFASLLFNVVHGRFISFQFFTFPR